MENNFYPVSLNLNNKLCMVVGGGKVALRRVSKLLKSGARIRLLSPTLDVGLQDLLQVHPNFSWLKKDYMGHEDLTGAYLVFAATNNPTLNQHILNDARSLGIFANSASDGELSDFIVPASFNQGDLQVSLSTSGKVPGLSKAIKESLEDTFGPNYPVLIRILEQVRHVVINDLQHKDQNLSIFSDMTTDYLSILAKLNSGVAPEMVRDQLLQLLK